MEVTVEKQEINVPHEQRVADEKKPRKTPLTCPNKVSSFFITVNTNYFAGDKAEKDYLAYKDKFENALASMLPQFWQYFDWHTSKLGEKFGYGPNEGIDILLKKDRVVENSLKYVLELSPSHRLHAHILFYVKTKGVDKKLSIPKLKAAFEEKLGHGVYCNYKLVPSVMTLENYMSKNPVN